MNLLHTLRCIGFAKLDRIARISGVSESDAESELIDLAVAGLVTRLPGEFGGWGLTEEGKQADAERTAEEVDQHQVRPQVTRAFDDFLVLNPELLDLCKAWQTQPDQQRVLALFADFDQRADKVFAQLVPALPRFARYRERLTEALGKVRSGQTQFLADELESYHAIWFQLHEDLLTTLGIPR